MKLQNSLFGGFWHGLCPQKETPKVAWGSEHEKKKMSPGTGQSVKVLSMLLRKAQELASVVAAKTCRKFSNFQMLFFGWEDSSIELATVGELSNELLSDKFRRPSDWLREWQHLQPLENAICQMRLQQLLSGQGLWLRSSATNTTQQFIGGREQYLRGSADGSIAAMDVNIKAILERCLSWSKK